MALIRGGFSIALLRHVYYATVVGPLGGSAKARHIISLHCGLFAQGVLRAKSKRSLFHDLAVRDVGTGIASMSYVEGTPDKRMPFSQIVNTRDTSCDWMKIRSTSRQETKLTCLMVHVIRSANETINDTCLYLSSVRSLTPQGTGVRRG